MNRSHLFLASAALCGFLGTAYADNQVFQVDPNHSFFKFTASTVLFDVDGRFEKYKVAISGDPETAADAKVQIELDTKSIQTGNKGRDDHLRSPDFFDATKNPKITFTSTSVKKDGPNKVVVEGTLDMHGQKRSITIPFETVTAKNGAGIVENVYKAELPLSRKDFGIGADSVAAKISLSDKVIVKLLLAGFFEAKKAK